MKLRGLPASAVLLGLAGLLPHNALAGLLGVGGTVQAFYYNGVYASPEGEDPVSQGNDDPAPLTAPVDYLQGAADGSTIVVGDTQITITNALSGQPFCFENSSGTACPDVIDGFDFQFTGEDILGVSVDPNTAADFEPVTGTFQGNTHSGLQLIGPNEIQVDVTGDDPALGDNLIIDLSFTQTAAPEPSTLFLLCGALGLFLLFRVKSVRGL